MRQSKLFSKTSRDISSEEVALNAQLLIRAGFIYKEMAGVYQLLPLGLRVVEKIKQIIREEMDALGAQEMLATTLQSKSLWEKSNRWSDDIVDIWFKTRLKSGGEVGLAWSHEEPLTNMMISHISSYKDLPVSIYQFQNKLRNELRAKSGVMRGREFLMKDLYSFAATEEQHNKFYDAVKESYLRIFSKLGIGDDTFVTFADGGAFTDFSHEFQTICDAGEDYIYLNKDRSVAINSEIIDSVDLSTWGVDKDDLIKTKTAEVGNIFNFGRSKSESLGLVFKDKNGESVPVWTGSYGIGVTRLMGVLVEKFSDEKGLVWSENVSPFKVHLIMLNSDDSEVRDWANGIYENLKKIGTEVLFDDRDCASGIKFSDSDLIGLPYRVILSRRAKTEGLVEVVSRCDGEVKRLGLDEMHNYF